MKSKKLNLQKKVQGITYLRQSDYAKINNSYPAKVSYYVSQGIIPVVKQNLRQKNGKYKVFYCINEAHPFPSELMAGRPIGT